MELSNLTLCYEGVQRVFRNAVVDYLRVSLTRAFGDEAAAKVAKPFKAEEWAKIRGDANAARSKGLVTSPIEDDFDLLSVGHFFNLFDSYRAELTPFLNAPAHKKLLEFIKMIKDIRDPTSHPTSADFSREDSFLLLDACRRVLAQLGMPEAAGKVKEVADRVMYGVVLPDTVRNRDPLPGRLPAPEAIVIDFIGRRQELDNLRSWFSDPQSRLWALGGEGGRGKSAVAYQFAIEIKDAAPQPYEAVLWLSAKKLRFREGETVLVETPDFSDLTSALDQLLVQYGWLAERALPLAKKRVQVLELLDALPALVVVDDVDSLPAENEDVIEFFVQWASRTRSKVLFTSRRTIFGLGKSTTPIKGFSESGVDEFTRSRCALWEIDPSVLTKSAVRQILEVTDGSPLYIEDLLRLAIAIPLSDSIRVWKTHQGDPARRYALGRELEMLSKDAKQVLFAACVSSVPVSFVELQEICGFADTIVTSALQELQKLFLVPKPRIVEGEQRYEVGTNTRALIREVEGSTAMYRQVEAAHDAVMKGVPQGRGEVGAIIRQATFLVKRGDHAEAEALLDKSLERYPSQPDLAAFKGWVYKQWRPQRVTDARENFRRAYELRCLNEELYRHWVHMESERQDWAAAIDAASKGLKRLPGNRKLMFLQGLCRSKLGQDLEKSMHHDKALKELNMAKAILENALAGEADISRVDQRLNCDIYRSLVITAEWMRDLPMVQKYLEIWKREHANDPMYEFESERLLAKLPSLRR